MSNTYQWDVAGTSHDLLVVDENGDADIVAWVYRHERRKTWIASVWTHVEAEHSLVEFGDLEEAKAWCIAVVRLN
jgi:hypothetical protein